MGRDLAETKKRKEEKGKDIIIISFGPDRGENLRILTVRVRGGGNQLNRRLVIEKKKKALLIIGSTQGERGGGGG